MSGFEVSRGVGPVRSGRRRSQVIRAVVPVLALLAGVAASGCSGSGTTSAVDTAATYAGAPGLTLSGVGPGWSFRDGQNITVRMAPNKIFTPHLRVLIIECADPGGTTGSLPTKFAACDENTVQGDTVLVQPDGSFVEHAYTTYRLPSKVLGEGPSFEPVCDATHQCVLYVGLDQNDFTQPKVFSHPFVVTASGSGGGG